jgi:putative redox protein
VLACPSEPPREVIILDYRAAQDQARACRVHARWTRMPQRRIEHDHEGIMSTIDTQTIDPGQFPLTLEVRGKHTLRVDVGPVQGGGDSAPGPHDFFDAALATCKAETAMWIAKKRGIPLERVEAHVDRDDSEEKTGKIDPTSSGAPAPKYALRVRLVFHGPLDDAQRRSLYEGVARCPIHKLMTTTEVVITTEVPP